MDNLMLKYFGSRIREPDKSVAGEQVPFVTLSREFGCPSKPIARQLAEELNLLGVKHRWPEWVVISKEIVEESAQKLKLSPDKIRHFNAENREIIYDVLSAFSNNYKSSRTIEKTTKEVIRTFARKGHVIIVGRGGAAITHGWPGSLHVRLQAPLEWRLQEISQSHSLAAQEAARLISEMDRKRTALIEVYLGHKFSPAIFDVCLNCQTMSKAEIVKGIIGLMSVKGLI